MSDPSDRRRRSSGKHRPNRQEMTRRRQAQAVQIRKQRKEEQLRSRRQLETGTKVVTAQDLLGFLDEFLQQPHESALLRLQNGMKASTFATNDFLKQLLATDEAKSRTLVSVLLKNIQNPSRQVESYNASLGILLDLSSVNISKRTESEDYYGTSPVRWSDILIQEEQLLPTLLQQLTSASSDAVLVENLSNIVGNLVQDARALEIVLPFWTSIAQSLPMTAYLCAAVVQKDRTNYGMDFLRHVTPSHIASLLQDSDKATDAAWILEGLSGREQDAIDVLCTSDILISTLIHCMEQNMAHSSFLVPALQAICNMTSAGEGRHVHVFLSRPQFVSLLTRLLEQGVVVDAVMVAGSLLADAGDETHPSTVVAVPAFLPLLIHILVSGRAVFDWKREATWAIYTAVNTSQENSQQGKELVRGYLWERVPQTMFLQALVDLLGSQDTDAMTAAIQVLDLVLRVVPASRDVFQSLNGGVDRLDKVCFGGDNADNYKAGDLEMVSNLAADLLDDFFNPENEQEELDIGISVQATENQFVFGLEQPSSAAAFDFSSNQQVPPAGRGRGRTLPAWMQQR